jgi:hypothetical protein
MRSFPDKRSFSGPASGAEGRGAERALSARRALRVLTLLLLAATTAMSAGCGVKNEEAGADIIAADVIYEEWFQLPETEEGSDAYMLLRHVLSCEIRYYGNKGEITLEDAELVDRLTTVKKRFAAALKAGCGLDPEEAEEIRRTAADELYLTYLTEDEVRTAYDREYDLYDTRQFSEFIYGVDPEEYAIIKYQQAVTVKYLGALREKALSELADQEVWDWYDAHRSGYDYREITVVLTASSPENADGALAEAAELAAEVNGSGDRSGAADALSERFSELYPDGDDAGHAVLYCGRQYSGLYAKVLEEAEAHEGSAYALAYEGNVYVVYLSGISEFSFEDIEDKELSRAVREALAEEKAADMAEDVPLRIG